MQRSRCCFTCGRELTRGVNSINNIQEERVFGLFPEFRRFCDVSIIRDAAARMRSIERGAVASMMADIPDDWDVADDATEPLIDLIVRRASFVADTIERKIWPQQPLTFDDSENESKS